MPRQDINPALIGTIVLLGACVFVLDYFYPLGVAIGALYTPLILITLWSADRRFTLIVTVGTSILTVVGLFYPLYGGGQLARRDQPGAEPDHDLGGGDTGALA